MADVSRGVCGKRSRVVTMSFTTSLRFCRIVRVRRVAIAFIINHRGTAALTPIAVVPPGASAVCFGGAGLRGYTEVGA